MRFRHLANPFKIRLQDEDPVPKDFLAEKKPLVLEIGFGRGSFLLKLAQKHPDTNFLGLETRKAYTIMLKNEIRRLKLKNCRIMLSNANLSLKRIIKKSSLSAAYILFPDPWVKKRHLNRRLVNKKFVEDLHSRLKKKAKVYIKTDEKFMRDEIVEKFESFTGFHKIKNRPLPFHTEREKKYRGLKKRIWQLTYQKTSHQISAKLNSSNSVL